MTTPGLASIALIINAAFLSSALASPPAADHYRFEGIFNFANTETDNSVDLQSVSAGFKVFVEPVNYTRGPLAEAAFLDRGTFFHAEIGKAEIDFTGFGNVPVNLEGELLRIAVFYADKARPVVAGITIDTVDADDKRTDYRLDIIRYNLGYYLNRHSLASLTVTDTNNEITANNIVLINRDATDYRIAWKNLLSLEAMQFIGLDFSVAKIDTVNNNENWQYHIAGNYYPDRTSDIGLLVSRNTGDNKQIEGQVTEINATKYLTSFSSVSLSYKDFSAESANRDYNQFRLNLSHRFK